MTRDEFESDLAKLQANATFGKTMEQVRHRVNVRLICDPNKLQKNTFNTIDIDMRTDFGTLVRPFPFFRESRSSCWSFVALFVRTSPYKVGRMERIIICHSDVNEVRRKRYCCDASRQMYEDYQRGHGLGNVISGLFRRVVLPFLKKDKKTFIRNALRTGMEVADDVLERESLKSSVTKRLPQGIKRTAGYVDWQTGSGFRTRRKTRDALS